MSITIKRATKIVDLCTNMELQADWEAAQKNLEDARRQAAADARESDTSELEAAAAVRELEQKMRADTLRFTLTAMPRMAWAAFVGIHRPDEADPVDKAFGVDVSALDGAIADMITGVAQQDGTEVAFNPGSEWEALSASITNPQWEDFATAVLALNQGKAGGSTVPFSRAASHVMRRSEKTSSSQSDLGSHPAV